MHISWKILYKERVTPSLLFIDKMKWFQHFCHRHFPSMFVYKLHTAYRVGWFWKFRSWWSFYIKSGIPQCIKKYQHFLCPLHKTSRTSHFCWLNFGQFFPTKLVVIFKICAPWGLIFFPKISWSFKKNFQKNSQKNLNFILKNFFNNKVIQYLFKNIFIGTVFK